MAGVKTNKHALPNRGACTCAAVGVGGGRGQPRATDLRGDISHAALAMEG